MIKKILPRVLVGFTIASIVAGVTGICPFLHRIFGLQ